VTSVAGHRLGKVIRCDSDTFVVEKGVFFPKDFELRYDHITDVTDGGITYLLSDENALQGTPAKESRRETTGTGMAAGAATGAGSGISGAAQRMKAAVLGKKEQLSEKYDEAKEHRAERKEDRAERVEGREERVQATEERAEAWPERQESSEESWDQRAASREPITAREPMTAGRGGGREERMSAESELRIPLFKEEMDVEKIQRESGHVRIHKAIKTEERRVSIPLRREEIVIEHVSAVRREGEGVGDGAFEDRIVDIPLHEEELRVGKHAVVREEVVVRTISQSFDRDATASLRSEDLEIEDTRPLPKAQTSPTGYGSPSIR